jgi:hypothetical protein
VIALARSPRGRFTGRASACAAVRQREEIRSARGAVDRQSGYDRADVVGDVRQPAPVPLIAVLLAWLVGVGVYGVGAPHGDAGEMSVGDLLDNPSLFDGRLVMLQGRLARLQASVTRKGNRVYSFQLSQGGREILVAVPDRPACEVGALVRVSGRFDGSVRRVDAAAVTCD